MRLYKILVELGVRGDGWGVSLGKGRVVGLTEDLGDGKTLADLMADGSVDPSYVAEEPNTFTPDVVSGLPSADADDQE